MRPTALQSYLRAHFTEPLTLDGLALVFRVNKYTLVKEFKQCWQVTPMEYLAGLRLQEGARLLAETGASIAAIAESTGFNSLPYFSTCFKKKYHLTPLVYRQTHARRPDTL